MNNSSVILFSKARIEVLHLLKEYFKKAKIDLLLPNTNNVMVWNNNAMELQAVSEENFFKNLSEPNQKKDFLFNFWFDSSTDISVSIEYQQDLFAITVWLDSLDEKQKLTVTALIEDLCLFEKDLIISRIPFKTSKYEVVDDTWKLLEKNNLMNIKKIILYILMAACTCLLGLNAFKYFKTKKELISIGKELVLFARSNLNDSLYPARVVFIGNQTIKALHKNKKPIEDINFSAKATFFNDNGSDYYLDIDHLRIGFKRQNDTSFHIIGFHGAKTI